MTPQDQIRCDKLFAEAQELICLDFVGGACRKLAEIEYIKEKSAEKKAA
jgi:hypothetical protein